MKIFTKSVIASLCVAGFCSVPAFAATDKEDDPRAGTISDTRLECYFEPCTEAPATPDKDGFIGKAALEQARPVRRRRVGLKMTGRGIAREECPVYDGERQIGVVTSGTHCPWLGCAVAMALVDAGYKEPGTALQVDVRGRRVEAEVVKTPFYKRG